MFLMMALWSCTGINGNQNALERNLKMAGANRPELEKAILHFSRNPADSLKKQAILFLISNMEELYQYEGEWLQRFDTLFYPQIGDYSNAQTDSVRKSLERLIGPLQMKKLTRKGDLKHLASEYLIKNTEEAFAAWQNAPWKNQVSFDAFCNYILPYKCYNEYAEDWRNHLRTRYQHILDDSTNGQSMVKVTCALVNEQLTWFEFSRTLGEYPAVLSIGQILLGEKGDCIEMASLGAYSARALGIPVAIDYTPQYGNVNDTHKWDALILGDGENLPFEGGETEPGEMAYLREGDHKFAKVYRRKLGWVEYSFAAKARASGVRHLPAFVSDPRVQDVTPSYTRVGDVRLNIKGKDGTPVYLCVFKLREWVAIAGGLITDDEVEFSNMGRGLVYMPMFYNDHRYDAAGPPVLLPAEGPQQFINLDPSDAQRLVLYRKFPFKRRWKQFLQNTLAGARFEAGLDSMFTDPVVLYEVPAARKSYLPKIQNDLSLKDRAIYDSVWSQAYPSIRDSFRYVRLVFDKELTFRLGEMEFYGPGESQPLDGRPIGNIPDPGLAFDGFPGRTIKLKPDSSKVHWAGLDLVKSTPIEKIRFIPATDANAIREGAMYELYYWKGKWVSAGIQKAAGFSLGFREVPGNGLYWLNCRECNSNEERIFTYEEGRQVWW
jgi:hypothetical protein